MTVSLLYHEPGIAWAWFTELRLDGASVHIARHYRLHYDDYDAWPDACRAAPQHPGYYGTERWRLAAGLATHYFVPHA